MVKPKQRTNISQQLDFPSSFKPNYYFLRALGLWPFSFVRDSDGKIQEPKITKLDLLWFIVSILLYILASIFNSENNQTKDREYMHVKILRIITYGVYLRLTLSLLFVALIIGIDMCNRFKLVKVLKTIVDFDDLVSFSILLVSFYLTHVILHRPCSPKIIS